MVDAAKLATWANAVTAGRLLLSPLMFLVIPDHNRGSWAAFGLWFVLCVSDGVDGWIARRHGVTSAGAFLDPLADKVLVLGAMFTLVARDVFPIVPVLIIAAREFIISVYRTVVGSKGVSVPASRMAKYKTLFQQLAVGFALWPLVRGRREVAVDVAAVDRRRARSGERRPVPRASTRRGRRRRPAQAL